ncbi:uncharacterized protein LOC132533520 isoform X2 [Erinaceus europaeus]|uniref:Uncharacterized protein LOC132533520 isoform X2 n=1 Tax=Erinaceus europaeus TaxID=9365 RepID=A0ABM3W509_ERIEU|nr:uncharacterized protein LOC132533520 isoform X2 [Erinaceus europaeus]
MGDLAGWLGAGPPAPGLRRAYAPSLCGAPLHLQRATLAWVPGFSKPSPRLSGALLTSRRPARRARARPPGTLMSCGLSRSASKALRAQAGMGTCQRPDPAPVGRGGDMHRPVRSSEGTSGCWMCGRCRLCSLRPEISDLLRDSKAFMEHRCRGDSRSDPQPSRNKRKSDERNRSRAALWHIWRQGLNSELPVCKSCTLHLRTVSPHLREPPQLSQVLQTLYWLLFCLIFFFFGKFMYIRSGFHI